MEVLIIGSRGREHALALSLKADPRVEKIYCIPGNGGLSEIAECVKLPVTDFDAILKFLDEHEGIGLTIVAPDESLSGGLVDLLNEKGHRAFGPSAAASAMESDKAFSRDLCAKYNIPAPEYKVFSDYTKAKRYCEKHPFPLVVKTNGRTAGKGIIICRNYREAENALYDVMIAELFGEAGKIVDIEEFLEGENVIVMTVTDGENVIQLPAVRAYKRVYDNDLGMNTAGMGAYMPAENFTKEVADRAMEEIFRPTVKALSAEGRPFKGVLAYSLILTAEGPKAVDFIVRFCDVESQVVLPMLKTPILDIIDAVIDGKLKDVKAEYKDGASVCVVLTSGGYPLEYSKNIKINVGEVDKNVTVFHAGTKSDDGELRTAGGRVMGVFSSGATLHECADRVYKNVSKINFDGMHYRKDIARNK